MKIILKSGKELELTPEELQELFGSTVPIVVPYSYPVPMPVYPTFPSWPYFGGDRITCGPVLNNCTTGTTNAP